MFYEDLIPGLELDLGTVIFEPSMADEPLGLLGATFDQPATSELFTGSLSRQERAGVTRVRYFVPGANDRNPIMNSFDTFLRS